MPQTELGMRGNMEDGMTGRFARGIPGSKLIVALLLGAILALVGGCGGGTSNKGDSRFSVGAIFATYTGREIQGFVGSISVTAQRGNDTPIDFGCIKRGDPRFIRDVKAEEDYHFVVTAYHSFDCTGTPVGRLTFVRRSPRRGETTDVTIDNVDTDATTLSVSSPPVIICGETVEIIAEARNAQNHVILSCGTDASLDVVFDPPSAGTMFWDNGACFFTATTDVDLDGTTVRFEATHEGMTAFSDSVLDCGISSVFLKLHWNKDLRRGLPGYANSAQLTLDNGFGNVVQICVNRPSANESIADVDFGQNVPDGDYNLNIQAFSGANCTGNVIAQEDIPITVDPGEAPITVNMDQSSFFVTQPRITLIRAGGNTSIPDDGDTAVLIEGETVEFQCYGLNDLGEVLLSGDEVVCTWTGAGLNQIDSSHVEATAQGGGQVTLNFGDAPSPFIFPVQVVFGAPGIIIHWDPPTRDDAPGYARSAKAEIFDEDGNTIPGYDPLCVNRPASLITGAYWSEALPPGFTYRIVVTLYPEWDCAGPALMSANSGFVTVPSNGATQPSTFDFPTIGNANRVEISVTRASGAVERYVDIVPAPVGTRNGPLFLNPHERVNISTRATNNAATTTYFTGLITSVDNDVLTYDNTNSRLDANKLGQATLTSSAQPGRGPTLDLDVRVMQSGMLAFTNWDPAAFAGMGAIKAYLYVPTATVNGPFGNKVWEVPYSDNSYLGLALAEPGVVLPTGFCNGYDVIQPAINSRADRLAFIVSPFDTVSGNVTYYKDLVVMDLSFDANGAPVFGQTRPQNQKYDTVDQICPQWGPQQDDDLDGILYYSSIEFDRNSGAYLGGTQRDIYVRDNVDAVPTPGQNITSGLAGNMFWPAVAPDNGELAVIRKDGFGTTESLPEGVGQIITMSLHPFAPSGEQTSVTAAAASRLCYVASKGIQIPGSSNPATLIDPTKYYIAFARSFDGGVTTEIQLIRAERTQAALGSYITQMLNASNPTCAAVDGPSGPEFIVTNPRRVMAFLRNGNELRAKNMTAPPPAGNGTLIMNIDPGVPNSQPTFPAPFDAFDPLPR